ncbi:MAG: molybdopterin biosynthesis protein [Candidatus Bathyarchaeia archaeon]|nr:molybdopterin biosynthesis protein [Candidatus Bathyarchaeota archaeon]
MIKRRIFRSLLTIEEVKTRIDTAISMTCSTYEVELTNALGKVLAEDVTSTIDVPGFDRSTMDGYAVKAQDTFSANEVKTKILKLVGKSEPGIVPTMTLNEGETSEISTGAPIPVGASAVVMVEFTKTSGNEVEISRSVTPGENVMAAGSDIMAGEVVLRRSQIITSREIAIMAAIGRKNVIVIGSPKVAILSTGNELIPPGSELSRMKIFDINAYSIAAAVYESGGTPIMLGIVPDDEVEIRNILKRAVESADLVLTSGSTSAGSRDLIPQIISSIEGSQIIANGLAVKPGKPALVAIVAGKPLFALPGNPTSALMVFYELVKPTIRRLSGIRFDVHMPSVDARLAFKTISVRGKQELVPVHIVKEECGNYLAYPALAGSGAITSLALADGFVRVSSDRDVIVEGETVQVHLFNQNIRPSDFLIVGSHCVGIDILLTVISEKTRSVLGKIINVGSMGGLQALKRGEADLAGIHLLDENSGDYNTPFIKRFDLENKIILVRGYVREQGFMTRKDSTKKVNNFSDLLNPEISFINRNRGSGTRILIDMCLGYVAKKKNKPLQELVKKINGYDLEAKSHSAVASAVSQGKVDVGFGIRTVAEQNGLDFGSHSFERFDFAINKNRLNKESIQVFLEILRSKEFGNKLKDLAPGLSVDIETGKLID